MISIFFAFLKYEKDVNFFLFFYENMLGKLLEFGCMHEKKYFFCFYFFLKEEINLKFFEFSIFF